MLPALADIIAELASNRPLEQSILHAIESLRRVLGAEEVAIWLYAPDGLVRAWGVGDAGMTVGEVDAVMLLPKRPPGAIIVARIASGDRKAGALAIRLTRELTSEERVLVTAVANLLAPELAHAEKSRQLEVEVEARTAEIDRERRFTEKIIDALPVGLYVIDREYRIQAWNRKRETGMQGVSREEAIGRTIFEILHRQPANVLRREFDEVFATGRLQIFQMESMGTGDLRTYRISKIPMRLDNGPVTHVITVGEDVTEWRSAQDRFAQAEKLAAIGTLAAGVMHEINNPLATIAACAESLELTYEDAAPEIIDGLRLIQSEVQRCKGIVDSLLDFSRPKAGDKTLVNVNDAIERTLYVLKHHTRFKKLAVQVELDRTLSAVVRANAEQLMQIFMSLLINAMDAMQDNGTVTLRTRWGEGARSVIAEIIDQGSGIRRADLPKIFEPFFTTKPPGRGTGLGLSICYAIVAEHDGRIEVDSAPGEGSVFRIILPRADETEDIA